MDSKKQHRRSKKNEFLAKSFPRTLAYLAPPSRRRKAQNTGNCQSRESNDRKEALAVPQKSSSHRQ
jgi:hypothetical protein